MKKIRRMISILTAVLMLLSCGILAAAEGELPEAAEIEAPAAEPVQEAKAEAPAPAPVKEEAKQEAPAPAPAKEEAKEEAPAPVKEEAKEEAPAAEPAKEEAKQEAPAAEPAEEAKEEAPAAEPAEEAKEEAPAAAAPAVQLKVAVKADCGARSVLLGSEVTLRAEVEGADEYDVRWEARELSWRRSNNAEEAEKAWTEVSKDKKYTFTVSESDAALEFRAVINGGEGVSDGYTLPKIEKPAEKAEEPAEEPEEPAESEEIPAEPEEIPAEPEEIPAEPEAAAEEPAQAEAEPVKAEEPEEKPAEKKAEKAEKAEKTEEIEDYETPLDSGIHYEYERNEDGSLKLDENGNPVAILEEGQNIPKTWLRDENGALVLDAEGNPVATQTVPADSVLVHSLQDQLDPNRSIDIYVSFVDGDAALGGTACFFAVLNGYDSLVYSLQWQESADGVNWMNLAAANQNRLEVVTSEENMHNFWRVEVTITSVQG